MYKNSLHFCTTLYIRRSKLQSHDVVDCFFVPFPIFSHVCGKLQTSPKPFSSLNQINKVKYKHRRMRNAPKNCTIFFVYYYIFKIPASTRNFHASHALSTRACATNFPAVPEAENKSFERKLNQKTDLHSTMNYTTNGISTFNPLIMKMELFV